MNKIHYEHDGRSNTKHNKVIVKVKVNMNGSLWEMGKLIVVNVMVKAISRSRSSLSQCQYFRLCFRIL